MKSECHPGRRPGGRPSKEEAERLGAKILDGARAVFGTKGIGHASLDEIASELGVSKHTIYRRYPGKAALLDAVVGRDIARFRQALVAAGEAGTEPLDKVRRIARSYVAFGTARDYAAFYLSVNAEAAVSPSLREQLAIWSAAALEPLAEAVSVAQGTGVLRPGDSLLARDVLIDLMEGVNNRVRLAAGAIPDVERLFEDRWQVFLAAMSTPADPGR
ncbi:TetR/AcrR family transcriptional regulator [Ancylobacter sp. MQZ15Z-1]|uniref:TetR/AcrR family transcriptional regulator n=1 Tax=Ancylobacter mangrovi TaxID=2972472 RepID=A0A9X2PJT8_9HYPH|nr:TetR/AcrR family transcriptional regulator [Ancylobacter mangrovi]MCS0495298.1 TetR/AcrR family transcriptional regulator [Ancylobacter mangrovi]